MPDPKPTPSPELTLSLYERKLILLVRTIKPYEVVELKLDDNRPGRLAVVVKSTVKEVFPMDSAG